MFYLSNDYGGNSAAHESDLQGSLFCLYICRNKHKMKWADIRLKLLQAQRLLTYLSPLRPIYTNKLSEMTPENAYSVEHYQKPNWFGFLFVLVAFIAITALLKRLISKK